jgi:hypothetical protein
MPLLKCVDGVISEMTPEEEAQFLADAPEPLPQPEPPPAEPPAEPPAAA